ncbi:META domain-containing protein [Thioalkalivibrio paradoxus]|uniref:META domain-containing protein n=1 Tax=Thioalkalivibrio paradoxus TaxID=108010 RepID=UPI00022C5BAF|nr:META domain-containing protein [Thioalkalivibrio paradoxus]
MNHGNAGLLALLVTAGMLVACGQPGATPTAKEPRASKSATPFVCGDTTVLFEVLNERGRMSVSGEAFDLVHARSASGARYVASDGSDTVFWNKGERAMVTIRGHDLPDCRQLVHPELPFRAYGQEPGWLLEISVEEILLLADYGTRELRMPRPQPRVTADGILYQAETADGQPLSVAIEAGICADIATGMPHPYRVRYELDGDGHSGCGGEPESLLTGDLWTVETMAGKPVVEGSTVTLQFLEEDHRLTGNTSCNRFTGRYTLTGEGLSLEPQATTLRACADPALDRQEARFLEILQRTFRFGIDASGRLLLHASGQETVVARR